MVDLPYVQLRSVWAPPRKGVKSCSKDYVMCTTCPEPFDCDVFDQARANGVRESESSSNRAWPLGHRVFNCANLGLRQELHRLGVLKHPGRHVLAHVSGAQNSATHRTHAGSSIFHDFNSLRDTPSCFKEASAWSISTTCGHFRR